ncbi:MAG: hypothetical protein HOF50_10335 [Candidatus Marinimicrobia bacterium]|nr:hypothetical protein [Candidatus Neomarinimicrobiota bacterium]MBT7113460.1 hypothetical protein [Candidatus Neomarinimicrobiota bacterium]
MIRSMLYILTFKIILTSFILAEESFPSSETQISIIQDEGTAISSINFYRMENFNKTIFFRIMDNGWNNRNEFRVTQLTGGGVWSPFENKRLLQIQLGGTVDAIKDSLKTNLTYMSRATYRPKKGYWFRIGFESFNGHTLNHAQKMEKELTNSFYGAWKLDMYKFGFIGLGGNRQDRSNSGSFIGGGAMIGGPFNTFAFMGKIRGATFEQDINTTAFGRWASWEADEIPSGIFIQREKKNYKFQIGGLFIGKKNLFIRPAVLGMTHGMFIGSIALRENAELRQKQLMSITDDHRYANISLMYVALDQKILIIPSQMNTVGFRTARAITQWIDFDSYSISSPTLGIYITEETAPVFNPMTFSFDDTHESYSSIHVGVTIANKIILGLLHSPERDEWTLAVSFVKF